MSRAAMSLLALLLLAFPAVAAPPVCTDSIILRIEKGSYADATKELTETQLDAWGRRIRELCLTGVDDLPNSCADGQLLGALGGLTVCTDVGAGAGTVTSVALSAPAVLTVSGSPITSSGTLALGLATQAAARVWAGPASGSDATPTFRLLVPGDIPALSYLADFSTLALTGDVTSSGLATTIAANAVALATDTTGDFVASLACGAGITGCPAAGEGATGTLAVSLGTSVSVGELAPGTAGQLITWDAAGDATTVAAGTATHVLTSNGPGAAPTFQAAAGGGSGDVVGPASSVDNQIVLFDATTGKLVKASSATVSGGFGRFPGGLQVDATAYFTSDGATTKVAIAPTGNGLLLASNQTLTFSMSSSALDTPKAQVAIVADSVLKITDGSSGNGWLVTAGRALKGADESVTSSATLQGDDALTFPVLAGRRYQCEARLHVTAGALGGIKVALGGTATATNLVGEVEIFANTTNALAVADRVSALGSSAEAVGDTAYFIEISAGFEVDAGGTLLISWAQQASSGTATTVLRGSSLRCEDFN